MGCRSCGAADLTIPGGLWIGMKHYEHETIG